MKALSIAPIYITEFMAGMKEIEYRSWQVKYRGDLLFCSTLNNDTECLPRGYALCVAELYDITGEKGDYEWHMRNIRPIQPFPVKGKLSIYDVEHEIEYLNLPDVDDVFNLWVKLGIAFYPE